MTATIRARVRCGECLGECWAHCAKCDGSGTEEVTWPADEIVGLVDQHGLDGDVEIIDYDDGRRVSHSCSDFDVRRSA